MVKKRDDNGITQHATAIVVPLALTLAVWGVVTYFVKQPIQVSPGFAALVVGLHWVVFAYLGWLLASRPRSFYLSAPIVRQVRDDGKLLMVSNAPWLGMRVQVSVYVMDGDFERQVGAGYVKNIQGNGLVQVHLPLDAESSNPFESIDLEKIIVKPGLFAEVA